MPDRARAHGVRIGTLDSFLPLFLPLTHSDTRHRHLSFMPNAYTYRFAHGAGFGARARRTVGRADHIVLFRRLKLEVKQGTD
jgi:hypothetical protein